MTEPPRRLCAGCDGPLSRFNPGVLCAPCQGGLGRVDPSFWRDPQIIRALGRWDLGAVVRMYRMHTGLSQAALARAGSVDQSEVSRIEHGHRRIRDRRQFLHWAEVLGVPAELAGAFPIADAGSERLIPDPRDELCMDLPAGTGQIFLRAGQSLPAGVLPALTIPADSFHADTVDLTFSQTMETWLQMPMRALVVGSRTVEGRPRLFAIDARQARRAMQMDAADRMVMGIPSAYQLDDLTYGILWAVAGFESAILGDDTALQHVLPLVAAGDPEAVSLAADEHDLAQGSRMLVGSETCARFVLAHRPQLSDAPVFWTREQRGEEAATWLVFRHKLRYLVQTATPSSREGSARMFCIPESSVVSSPRHERVLLFLAIALMESFGIRTRITSDQGYRRDRRLRTDSRPLRRRCQLGEGAGRLANRADVAASDTAVLRRRGRVRQRTLDQRSRFPP